MPHETIDDWESELCSLDELKPPCQRWYGIYRVQRTKAYYQVFVHGPGKPARILFECPNLAASRYQCAAWLFTMGVSTAYATLTCPEQSTGDLAG
ncbi:MAG: hypothetical protein K8L99_04890 [Anaerolineae bacterium]|nr:hypothetical protein [Anaerolineae bacterium]